MLSLNRPSIGRYLGVLCWVAISTLSACQPVSAQENQQDSKLSNVPKGQNQAKEATVPEGRAAVSFYHDTATTTVADKEPLRLSNKVTPYPVKPVDRPRPLLELGAPFLGNGPIRPGIKTPTGEMLQP
jgi:hypothetical protein